MGDTPLMVLWNVADPTGQLGAVSAFLANKKVEQAVDKDYRKILL